MTREQIEAAAQQYLQSEPAGITLREEALALAEVIIQQVNAALEEAAAIIPCETPKACAEFYGWSGVEHLEMCSARFGINIRALKIK
jgi:hypothetical protein